VCDIFLSLGYCPVSLRVYHPGLDARRDAAAQERSKGGGAGHHGLAKTGPDLAGRGSNLETNQ
jgi:hypothetical protein